METAEARKEGWRASKTEEAVSQKDSFANYGNGKHPVSKE